MNQMTINGEVPVFGLDIGTRSVVGTIGYKQGERFVVVAQEIREHQTRAMLDGQIHDINRVSATIADIKHALEEKTGLKLQEVCIAAAGRVLKTMNVHVDFEFDKERPVTKDDMNTLVSMGIEKAFSQFQETNDSDMHFYCVGYSIVKYYLNNMWMGQPEHHKAKNIGADMIATFLPDDVVDGLYSAVELAGLKVMNMTLEPIAAIRIAIPEKFRLLNIAMIDVGAGTSDISITNDGSVIAFGMIPFAGDSITEALARNCLIDFATAEKIKTGISTQSEITYEDIMGLEQTITADEVVAICQPEIDKMAKLTANTIKELNGGNSPSAVFIVGGGGKIRGFAGKVADELGLDRKRVALRGEEIMRDVDFPQGSRKDSTIVTPIGICLSYYEQNNKFIYVTFNGSKIKLYDNNKLAVVDAAIQASFSREGLFPRRGREIHYTVNGKKRVTKGEYGESAQIFLNGEAVNLSHPIKANDVIVMEESTEGKEADIRISNLLDYNARLTIVVNGEEKHLPKPVKVNGKLETEDYRIQDGDVVSLYSYYTYDQILAALNLNKEKQIILINGEKNSQDSAIYAGDHIDTMTNEEYEQLKANGVEEFNTENKDIVVEADKDITEEDTNIQEQSAQTVKNEEKEKVEKKEALREAFRNMIKDAAEEDSSKNNIVPDRASEKKATESNTPAEDNKKEESEENSKDKTIVVIVNKKPIVMKGKPSYMFVDIFDYINFDTSKLQGAGIATLVNGHDAQYMQEIKSGDNIEVYWK